jgi:hypothetical protein
MLKADIKVAVSRPLLRLTFLGLSLLLPPDSSLPIELNYILIRYCNEGTLGSPRFFVKLIITYLTLSGTFPENSRYAAVISFRFHGTYDILIFNEP